MENNQFHKHYAIQLSIPIAGTLTLFDDTTEIPLTTGVFIKPNVSHRLDSTGNNLHIFFNPHSRKGLFIKSLMNGNSLYFDKSVMTDLVQPTMDFIQKKIDIKTLASFIERCGEESERFKVFELTASERIIKVLDYLYDNRHRWVQAEECASLVHLSKSRFLHFFKEQTGSTFRRSQLWIRITESIGMLEKKGISEAAYHYGFHDNAHYGRVFKENLGFTPKTFINSAVLYNVNNI